MTHPANQHQPDHFAVAHERPERILKGRRFILLDEEMANPGGAVAGDESQRKKPPPANDDEENQADERDCGSNEVKQPCAGLTVLSNIVGPEFGE